MGKSAALFAVAVAAVLWAGSGTAAQHFFAHSEQSALALSNIRMSLAGLLLLAVAWQSGGLARGVKVLREKPRLLLDLVLYAAIGIFLVQFSYFQGISLGNAAAATVIEYTCPAMVICWEAIRAWKWPKPGEAAAVVMASLGIFLLVTGGDTEKLLVPLACVLWCLLSSACFAFAAIYPRHLLLEFDPYFLLAAGLLIGGAGSSFFVETLDWRPFFAPEVVFDICFIVVGGTALAFVLFNAGLLYLSPEQATVTATIEPAASVFLASVIFGTRFGAAELFGVGLVLVAILMPILPYRKFRRARKKK
ncbi:MAG: EamA family transporter [Schwartzia sp.]|nr:EamA family transporter [Schwartzia sp. (in: firmicutes)]